MTTRRRFVSILAACSACGPVDVLRAEPVRAAAPEAPMNVWRGTALGALASMTLVHPDPAKARATIAACVQEIERLEAIFSLYRPDSALCRLNADGELRAPPTELVELLSFALSLSRLSGGAFDPTVQPLYRLYADHFARPGAAASGPSRREIDTALACVGFEAVELRAGAVRLGKPRMQLTLNGVAQGFFTDRVTDRLHEAGFDHVIVDLGEARALGRRADGQDWRAGIADPLVPERTLLQLPLAERPGAQPALATSGGYGTRFGADPRIHHLLNPHTGRSANYHLSVTVGAPRATLADGLSTTLAVVPREGGKAILKAFPTVRVVLVDEPGRWSVVGT